MKERLLLAVALALVAVSCGGGEGATTSVGASGDTPSQEVTTPTSPAVVDSTEPDQPESSGPAGESAVAVPIVRFAAHGPQAANTIGPQCAEGLDARGGDVFRFTPPPAWVWQGTSGGSSYDEVTVIADGVRMTVTQAAYEEDKERLREFVIIGPAGVDVDLGGEAVPIIQITLGGAPGYAIVDLPYMNPLPVLDNGALGTIVLTSDSDGGPTLEVATELLGSVRVERCAAVGQAMIWGPVKGVHLVPRFEPDPLGKTYPDQPQPAHEATTWVLDAYSLEQVAYLMPVGADIAECAAAKAVEFGADNPIGYLLMFLPGGTNRVEFDALMASC